MNSAHGLEIKQWVVTLKHDAGTVRIQTAAPTAASAETQVLLAEHAPASAVISVEELEPTTKVYVVGYNMSGYLPEMDPYATTDYESAQRFMIDELKRSEDFHDMGPEDDESEGRAEELCHAAEELNLHGTPKLNDAEPWDAFIGNMHYWITVEEVPESEVAKHLLEINGEILD